MCTPQSENEIQTLKKQQMELSQQLKKAQQDASKLARLPYKVFSCEAFLQL